MNFLTYLSQTMQYRDIALKVYNTTGQKYTVDSLGNVKRGHKPLNERLLACLTMAFREEWETYNVACRHLLASARILGLTTISAADYSEIARIATGREETALQE